MNTRSLWTILGLIVIALSAYYLFTAKELGITNKREVILRFECSNVVKVTIYKKPLLSFPPPIILPRYEHHLLLENGHEEVDDSIFPFGADVGESRCRTWTEYVN